VSKLKANRKIAHYDFCESFFSRGTHQQLPQFRGVRIQEKPFLRSARRSPIFRRAFWHPSPAAVIATATPQRLPHFFQKQTIVIVF